MVLIDANVKLIIYAPLAGHGGGNDPEIAGAALDLYHFVGLPVAEREMVRHYARAGFSASRRGLRRSITPGLM